MRLSLSPYHTAQPPNTRKVMMMKRSFISEQEIQQKRQRSAADSSTGDASIGSAGADEEYDPRPLYERLKEQRQKKEEAFQQQLKLGIFVKIKNSLMGGVNTGNMVHVLDDEEFRFLSDLKQLSEQRQTFKEAQDQAALSEFKRFLSLPPP